MKVSIKKIGSNLKKLFSKSNKDDVVFTDLELLHSKKHEYDLSVNRAIEKAIKTREVSVRIKEKVDIIFEDTIRIIGEEAGFKEAKELRREAKRHPEKKDSLLKVADYFEKTSLKVLEEDIDDAREVSDLPDILDEIFNLIDDFIKIIKAIKEAYDESDDVIDGIIAIIEEANAQLRYINIEYKKMHVELSELKEQALINASKAIEAKVAINKLADETMQRALKMMQGEDYGPSINKKVQENLEDNNNKLNIKNEQPKEIEDQDDVVQSLDSTIYAANNKQEALSLESGDNSESKGVLKEIAGFIEGVADKVTDIFDESEGGSIELEENKEVISMGVIPKQDDIKFLANSTDEVDSIEEISSPELGVIKRVANAVFGDSDSESLELAVLSDREGDDNSKDNISSGYEADSESSEGFVTKVVEAVKDILDGFGDDSSDNDLLESKESEGSHDWDIVPTEAEASYLAGDAEGIAWAEESLSSEEGGIEKAKHAIFGDSYDESNLSVDYTNVLIDTGKNDVAKKPYNLTTTIQSEVITFPIERVTSNSEEVRYIDLDKDGASFSSEPELDLTNPIALGLGVMRAIGVLSSASSESYVEETDIESESFEEIEYSFEVVDNSDAMEVIAAGAEDSFPEKISSDVLHSV